MLDEDLFEFGLSLPYKHKTRHHQGKRLLRLIAKQKLPAKVVKRPKKGFAIPVDQWVNTSFRSHLRDVLLGSSCRLRDFFRKEAYEPVVEAFCSRHPYPGLCRQGHYQRIMMLLAANLALESKPTPRISSAE